MKNEIAIGGMFFITLITRVGFMFFDGKLKLNSAWQYILKLAPAVALGCSIALDTFFIQNHFIGIIYNLRLWAVLACIISFICFKKIWLSLIIGILFWAFLIKFYL